MQVRYVFDPDLQQARARLALSLVPWLAERCELKAEAPAGKLPEGWRPLYHQLSRPLPQPRVQLYHGPAADFKPHPLQWNVVIDPLAVPAGADEIWVFSVERCQALARQGATCRLATLPPAAGELPESGELPMELPEARVLLCSLPSTEQLKAVIEAYVPAFYGNPDVTLALHLDGEDAESGLMSLLEQSAAAHGAELEKLNLETWIGPLEPGAYAALLRRADALLAPGDSLQAHEALTLGKAVITEVTPESLQAALEAGSLPQGSGLSGLGEAMLEQLQRIEREVDFEARAAAWQQAQEQAHQEGRKQKYSLFHSDYDGPEMQARRQWHLSYARHFEDAPGEVLDIGCGSGIFLEIMREQGLPACGVDPDPDMVDVCRKLGLQAMPGDERELAQWQAESLGGIHASHVIEHIDGSRAIALIENAWRSLRPGGKLIIRTPNWRNQTVRHEGFWLDITHIRPYPLPLLQQVLTDAGFSIALSGFEDFGWNDTFIIGLKAGGNHG